MPLADIAVCNFLTGVFTSRNRHPEHCLSTEELSGQGREKSMVGYDRPGVGAHLVGRAKRVTPPRITTELVQLLPGLLAESESRVADDGWAMASPALLAKMQIMNQLKIQVFRQALLNNRDLMSSELDDSQPKTKNGWGLVAYEDDRGAYYLCVMEVLYYARVEAESPGMKGFDPTLCGQYGVGIPDMLAAHRPIKVAVGRLWLATPCTAKMGALGCREAYDPLSSMPPDMVAVENMSTSGLVVHGSRSDVVRSNTASRYYGIKCVHVDSLCCQLGPTRRSVAAGLTCFLVCSKRSGKKRPRTG